MQDSLAEHFLANSVLEFRGLHTLAEKAVAQVDDATFFGTLDPESNSIAILLKHLAGNMRSRWTDFLTTDGEKPDRDRDSEFIVATWDTRHDIEHRASEGWQILFDALAELGPNDLQQKVRIRGEAHTVVQAIQRQLTHYGYHVGQLVLLAKHGRTGEWRTLSIPRGGTLAFNARLREWYGGGSEPGAQP